MTNDCFDHFWHFQYKGCEPAHIRGRIVTIPKESISVTISAFFFFQIYHLITGISINVTFIFHYIRMAKIIFS